MASGLLKITLARDCHCGEKVVKVFPIPNLPFPHSFSRYRCQSLQTNSNVYAEILIQICVNRSGDKNKNSLTWNGDNFWLAESENVDDLCI